MSNSPPLYPVEPQPALPRSGLVHLRNEVARYFAENEVPAVVTPVGLKYRSFTLNQELTGGGNRVCFIPGEFDGSTALKPRAYGNLSRETRNATSVVNPRELAQWERAFTLSIWAAPQPGAGSDEQASHEMAEDLLEQVVRAISAARVIIPDTPEQNYGVGGAVSWGEVTLTAPPIERSFGVELLVQALLRGPLFDRTLDVVHPSPVMAARPVSPAFVPHLPAAWPVP